MSGSGDDRGRYLEQTLQLIDPVTKQFVAYQTDIKYSPKVARAESNVTLNTAESNVTLNTADSKHKEIAPNRPHLIKIHEDKDNILLSGFQLPSSIIEHVSGPNGISIPFKQDLAADWLIVSIKFKFTRVVLESNNHIRGKISVEMIASTGQPISLFGLSDPLMLRKAGGDPTVSSGLSGGAIAGIIIGVLVLCVAASAVGYLMFKQFKEKRMRGSTTESLSIPSEPGIPLTRIRRSPSPALSSLTASSSSTTSATSNPTIQTTEL